ncbi:MAG: hypothetical protein JRC87_10105, partial [Deltaproteobacteria bacterium]|nr:hypothetical protein [Deltaproteobacteria bacterium]
GDEDYDITVQLKESNREVVDILHELMLPTPSGQMVPLSASAGTTTAMTPIHRGACSIRHTDQVCCWV